MEKLYSYLKFNDKLNPEVGELPLRAVLKEFIAKTPEGQVVEVKLSNPKGKRTYKMNNYMSLILRIVERETGVSYETLKEVMKAKFLTSEIEINGEKMSFVKNTSSLSVIEMLEFVEKIKKFWFDYLQLVFPEPEQFDKDDKKEGKK